MRRHELSVLGTTSARTHSMSLLRVMLGTENRMYTPTIAAMNSPHCRQELCGSVPAQTPDRFL